MQETNITAWRTLEHNTITPFMNKRAILITAAAASVVLAVLTSINIVVIIITSIFAPKWYCDNGIKSGSSVQAC